MSNKRRLLHEFWLSYPKFLKENPDLNKITSRKVLNLFVEKHEGIDNALKELIKLNDTENTHTIFCEDCGKKIDPDEEDKAELIRGRPLCYKHQCNPIT